MSLFKKPKKNLRQRSNLNEDEGETEELAVKIENAPASIPKSSSSKIKAVEIKKSTSTLSFQEDLEEDEGVETFQIKKSSQSRRIAKKMERDRKMKEQQKLNADSTSKAAPAAVQEAKREVKEEVLFPEVQKTQEPKKLILSGREAEMAGYRSESDEEDAHSDREDVVKFRKPEPFRNVLESRARETSFISLGNVVLPHFSFTIYNFALFSKHIKCF
jgi:GC-rich sequence DNA-binding factor